MRHLLLRLRRQDDGTVQFRNALVNSKLALASLSIFSEAMAASDTATQCGAALIEHAISCNRSLFKAAADYGVNSSWSVHMLYKTGAKSASLDSQWDYIYGNLVKFFPKKVADWSDEASKWRGGP